MKRIIIPICILLAFSCQTKQKVEEEEEKQSLWTTEEFKQFIDENSITHFDAFYNRLLIGAYMYDLTYKEFTDTLKTQEFKNSYLENKNKYYKTYLVDISLIAGKTKAEVELVLGKPNNKESINPSGTPCPCDKLFYLNNLVEIVFMNGVADWITVNNRSNYVSLGDRSNYISVDHHEV